MGDSKLSEPVGNVNVIEIPMGLYIPLLKNTPCRRVEKTGVAKLLSSAAHPFGQMLGTIAGMFPEVHHLSWCGTEAACGRLAGSNVSILKLNS